MMRKAKNKSKQVADSILARIKLLERIIATPKDFLTDSTLKSALHSQASFASLSYEFGTQDSEKITPLSITTLKAKTSTISEGFSWDGFERLRLQALESLDRAPQSEDSSTKQSKVGLQQQIIDIKLQLERQQETNIRLIQALTRAVNEIGTVSNTNKAELRSKRARDAVDAINETLGLNDFPFNRADRPAVVLKIVPEDKS